MFLNVPAECSLNIRFERSWNVPQEHSENIAFERSKNPDIFLALLSKSELVKIY